MAVKKEITELQMEQEVTSFASILAQQPKRKVKLYLAHDEFIRLSTLEKAGKPVNWPCQTVSINGYNFYIQLGKECEVPESVYEGLQNAHLV
ncbi:hypothetical protein UFOVP103_6 [uncultured Caudovirales phage]|uniref:Uncharacterized protein n=1 Tax=uncultured Caudovirales phage TaxID=2100421 RepID=A0A6J7WHW6_9CAUD|nr:hypothetical protein UFOVP103_6 [uncultured Caudovirales phage]CAB5216853.1 hypothetical protein UFOVP197_3 [uncultured Caudovirales phage]